MKAILMYVLILALGFSLVAGTDAWAGNGCSDSSAKTCCECCTCDPCTCENCKCCECTDCKCENCKHNDS